MFDGMAHLSAVLSFHFLFPKYFFLLLGDHFHLLLHRDVVGSLKTELDTGLPDFSRCMIPKPKKYAELTQNVPNGHKMYKLSINIPNGHKI
jgi:hypothetical protein